MPEARYSESEGTGPGPRFRSHVLRVLDRAADAPGQTILVDSAGELSAGRFAQMVRTSAVVLRDRGVGRGDVVALAAPITIQAIVTRYAAGLLGCATTFCPTSLDEPGTAAYLTVAAADVLIGFPQTQLQATALVASGVVRDVIVLDPDALASPVALPDGSPEDLAVSPEDDAVLSTSGGTTGRRKLSCRSFSEWLAMVDMGPAPERRQLICSSLAYIAHVHLDQTLMGGGVAFLRERFDPAEILETIERERITHIALVEPKLAEMVEHPDIEHRDLSSLMLVSHIGADAAPSLRRRWLERLGPVLLHSYGLSEIGIVSLLLPHEYNVEHPQLLGTAGRVLPSVDARIAPIDGLARGEGRIQVRSRTVTTRFRFEGAYAPRTDDGWFDTGDIGSLDEDGYLRVRGRLGDALSIAGRLLLPVDVQEALCTRPDLSYAAVIPLTEPPTEFAVATVLVPGEETSPEDLRDDVRAKLGMTVPMRIAIVPRVPTTEQGKPDRAEIRRLANVAG